MELNAEQIIQGLRDNDSPYESDQDNIADAIALIKQLTEEIERLRAVGEWIDTGDKELDTIYSGYKCSVCGFIICGHSGKYCSECGAKMTREK